MSLSIINKAVFDVKPQAIIFDTDNTLYQYAPAHIKASEAVERKSCKLLGIEKKEFRDALLRAKFEIKERLGGVASSHSRLLYYQRAIEIITMNTKLLTTLDLEQTYWRTFLHASELFPGVRDLLQDLKTIEVKTAIITDLTAQIQFRKIIYFGLEEYFDYVVTSEEAGFDKPHKAAFQLTSDKLKVEPKNCWMIGDNPVADIKGGNDFKMITLQKQHAGVKVTDAENCADAVFDDFDDIRSLFLKNKWLDN